MPYPITKTTHLADPVATTGDRVYVVCSQNGLFPDPWGGHVPHEMWGVWDHPIKLLDGFWFAVQDRETNVTRWLTEAESCTVGLGYTEFSYRLDDLRVTRRDFVPDGLEGLVVTITVDAPAARAATLDLVASFRSDLRPAWLGERVRMVNHPDTVTADESHVVFQDEGNPWFCAVGCNVSPTHIVTGSDVFTPQQTVGQGTNAQLTLSLHEATSHTFVIAGSRASEADVLATYARICSEATWLFETKQAHYAHIVESSHLHSPDAAIDAAFQWTKLNCQMLARHVPEHGLAAGAGLPTYPWWFGIDSEYAVLPMLQAGQFDLVKSTLDLLKHTSERHNAAEPGRVIHELATTGVVFNPGNLVETPIFIRAVHDYWLWTGDAAFLAEMYPFCKTALLDFTLGQRDPDGDLCATGRSITETLEMHAGFECLDVAAYTWEALVRLIDLAQATGDTAIIADLSNKAATLARCILDAWWLPDDGLFADVRAPVSQVKVVLECLDQRAQEIDDPNFRQQARKARELFQAGLTHYADQPDDIDLPWLLRHWIVMCPIEVGLATPDQATQSLQRLTSPEFCNEWGMFLHPDRADVMSINTGLLTLALARYGQIDTALRFIQQQAATLTQHMPGAISEAFPDQWCFIQLWSVLGIVSPIVEGLLGIAPRAAERRLAVIPNLPTGWDHAKLKRMHVGNAHFDVEVTKSDDHYTVTVGGDAADYRLEIGAYLPADARVIEVTLNGDAVAWQEKATLAGRSVVCEANVPANVVVRF